MVLIGSKEENMLPLALMKQLIVLYLNNSIVIYMYENTLQLNIII